MLTVLDQAVAERGLAAASISCPSCSSARLRPWGYARARVLRCLARRRSVRPRRARCRNCAATHVLLPADAPPRHADTLEVVVTALLAHHTGAGHHRIVADLGVLADTVRSWLRRVTARAEWLRQRAPERAYQLDPMCPAIAPAGSALGDPSPRSGSRRPPGDADSGWRALPGRSSG